MSAPRGALVDPEWLKARLGDPGVRILDVRKPEQYLLGHLPGAVNVDIFDLHWWDSSTEGLQGFRSQHEQAFGNVGFTRQDTVVVYGDSTDGMAARGLWVLTVLGQQEVYLLDGGLPIWRAADGAIETGETVSTPTVYHAEWNPAALAGWEETRAAIGRSGSVILDTRSLAEYRGENVRSKHGGAIPGAIHLEYTANINPDGRLKSPDELAAIYRDLGVTPEDDIIAYCRGGYRAANTWLALTMAGYPRVRNYISSWGEWGNRDDLPIEKPA